MGDFGFVTESEDESGETLDGFQVHAVNKVTSQGFIQWGGGVWELPPPPQLNQIKLVTIIIR